VFAQTKYVDEPLTDDLLARVEASLSFVLPKSYVALCRNQNGGAPKRNCHRTASPTTWAFDHVAITNIKAIGFGKTWSLCGLFGQSDVVGDGGYPPIGVYFADCPSAGHDMLCLDYRNLNADGEPTVVHVDQEWDYQITPVADSFESFIRGLESSDAFDSEGDS
jgi:hypothetical protein